MPGGRPSRGAIHERLAFEVRELRERLGGLPRPHEAEDIWIEIWRHEAHNSTAIEGNTLVLKEVEILLSEGRAVGDKQLKDYLEVTGYADSTGSAAMNTKLSEDRAKAVVTYLMQQGAVPMRHIVAPGAMGEYGAAAPNETKSGRAENRRVEVKVLVNKGIAGS